MELKAFLNHYRQALIKYLLDKQWSDYCYAQGLAHGAQLAGMISLQEQMHLHALLNFCRQQVYGVAK